YTHLFRPGGGLGGGVTAAWPVGGPLGLGPVAADQWYLHPGAVYGGGELAERAGDPQARPGVCGLYDGIAGCAGGGAVPGGRLRSGGAGQLCPGGAAVLPGPDPTGAHPPAATGGN